MASTACFYKNIWFFLAIADVPIPENREDFIKLGMPLEEALTETTFVVEWLISSSALFICLLFNSQCAID